MNILITENEYLTEATQRFDLPFSSLFFMDSCFSSRCMLPYPITRLLFNFFLNIVAYDDNYTNATFQINRNISHNWHCIFSANHEINFIFLDASKNFHNSNDETNSQLKKNNFFYFLGIFLYKYVREKMVYKVYFF